MLKINFNAVASMFVLLMLSACGGDGSDASTSTSTAIGAETAATVSTVVGPLTKYAGTWIEVCDSHEREAITFTVSSDGTSMSAAGHRDYFLNEDCTGDLVATEADSGVPMVHYISPVANASVTMLSGSVITVPADLITVTVPSRSVTVTGSGVTQIVSNGMTMWQVAYGSNGASINFPTTYQARTTQEALFLLNGKLVLARENNSSTSSFIGDAEYTR